MASAPIVAPPTAPSVPTTTTVSGAGPIYYKQSATKRKLLQVYFVVICVAVFSAMIYNTAIAIKDGLPVLFLSVCNMLVSSIIGLVLLWWYRNDDLPDEKLWYLVTLGILILFQCITADVFVGHAQVGSSPTAVPTRTPPPGTPLPPKTLAPPTTHHHTAHKLPKTTAAETG